MLVSGFHTANELVDCRRLITAWLIGAFQLEFHRRLLLSAQEEKSKPLLYPAMQVGRAGCRTGTLVPPKGFSWDRSAYILRHIRQQRHLRAAFCAYQVTDFVGPIGEGNDNVHGLLSVFAGVNEQSRCRGNVEDGFIGSRCCARSSEAAVLIILWRRVLRRGSLPKLRVDKDHRTGVCH